MRTLLLIVGVILIAAAVGMAVGESTSPTNKPAREWVRTVDGWEPLAVVTATPPRPRTLHPLVVAGVQLFASLGVLVASSPDR